ncbi:MAG TPA: lytic transglycosylase domain-containing protein [Oscillatoriaceae cyanobacterium]
MSLSANSFRYPYNTRLTAQPSFANAADPLAVLEHGQPAKHQAAHHTTRHTKRATHHVAHTSARHTAHTTTHHTTHTTAHHAPSASAKAAPHLIAPPKHASAAIRRWWPDAQKAGQKYGIDPRLVLAVISVESSGNPHAVSSVGARGLMQLMPATARGLGVSNVNNPQQNIDGGVRYLSQLMKRYGQTSGIRAYNGGPGGRHLHQTATYAETVLQHYRRFLV